MDLAIAVIVTAVLGLIYVTLEYGFVPKHGSNSGIAAVSLVTFLFTIISIVTTIILAVSTLAA